jgi:hypothetical protein
MPSKGIQAYCYICVPGVEVVFSVPGRDLTKSDQSQWTIDHLEVDSSAIHGGFNFDGQFKFTVRRNGADLTSQWVEVNSMTGNVSKGTMHSMFDQTSFVADDIIVTHLFYVSGHGESGLPKMHQCLVTVSPNRSNWQGEAAAPGTPAAGAPFRRFVLPAAHDIGMNSMETPDLLVQKAGAPFVNLLKVSSNAFSNLADHATEGIVSAIAPNIIAGLAVTQKDTLATVLAIGARYFEFRPAHLHDQLRSRNVLPDELYFTHGPIPGMRYDAFLQGVVAFLAAHPSELVVVQLRWDGVPAQCARPDDAQLNQLAEAALAQSGGSVKLGNLDDMRNLSTEDLRNQAKRLLLFKNADVYSSYTDAGNATLNGDSIVAEYEHFSTDEQNKHQLTNVQCQATATNIKDVVVHSALTAGTSNSCLMATKPICDSKTLPWIRNNLLGKLQGDQLMLVMNDFIDGATVDVAVDLSRRRLG